MIMTKKIPLMLEDTFTIIKMKKYFFLVYAAPSATAQCV